MNNKKELTIVEQIIGIGLIAIILYGFIVYSNRVDQLVEACKPNHETQTCE